MQSRRNLLKYLVRVEMASDWFTRIYRSILAEQISYKNRDTACKLGCGLFLSPQLKQRVNYSLFETEAKNKACFWIISPLKASKWSETTFCILSNNLSCISERVCLNFEQINIPPRPAPSSFLDRILN